MKFKVNRESFLNCFLKPLCNSSVEIVSVRVAGNQLYSIVNDNKIFIYSLYEIGDDEVMELPDGVKINIGNIKSLLTLFSHLKDEFLELELKSNHLKYDSKGLKFKYFLLSDCVVPPTTVKKEKMDSFDCDFKAFLDKKTVSEILKSDVFVNTQKVSFFTKDSELWASLGDPSIPNKNELDMVVTNEFEGTGIKVPLRISSEALKMFSGVKYDKLEMHVNTSLGVFLFKVTHGDNNNAQLRILTSAHA